MLNHDVITMDTIGGYMKRLGVPEADSEASPTSAPSANGHGSQYDVTSFLSANGVKVKHTVQEHDRIKYILEECPFDETHKGKDAAVFVRNDGVIGFKCFHDSCAGKKWRDVRQHLDPDAYSHKREHASSHNGSSPRREPERIEYQWMTLAELEHVPEPEYFIPDILEQSQPGVIAGQYKALKTTVAVELGFSLATGHPFLGRFPVRQMAKVGMFSGEAGSAQVRNSVRRIARFHNEPSPWIQERLILSFERLPKLGSPAYMDALERSIADHELRVVIIDPGYAAMAGIGNQAGNYYAVAELLFGVTELQRKTGCVILIAPHMVKAAKYDPPMLSDIQWSGFSEWAGQWILLGKRREWDDTTGQHWLWMVAGGRSGHASTYGLDVREGRQDDPGGKVFDVDVLDKGTASTVATAAAAERTSQQKEAARARERDEAEELIRRAFVSLGDGWHIKAQIMERTGTSGKGKVITSVWGEMLRSKVIEESPGACTAPVNNKPCTGYRLANGG